MRTQRFFNKCIWKPVNILHISKSAFTSNKQLSINTTTEYIVLFSHQTLKYSSIRPHAQCSQSTALRLHGFWDLNIEMCNYLSRNNDYIVSIIFAKEAGLPCSPHPFSKYACIHAYCIMYWTWRWWKQITEFNIDDILCKNTSQLTMNISLWFVVCPLMNCIFHSIKVVQNMITISAKTYLGRSALRTRYKDFVDSRWLSYILYMYILP